MIVKSTFNKLIIDLFILNLITEVYCLELFSSDPDIDRNSSQLIESRGFISETHNVITRDGYILTIFRIINPYHNKSSKPYPVYLQHGYIQNSDSWLISSHGLIESNGFYTEESNLINNCSSIDSVGRTLAFVLSACGYDVWLGNFRGNKYSSHLYLDPNKDMKYWAFTNDQYTAYDITATLQHVLKTTNSETIGYIGHSLGTTIVFQLLSTHKEYSQIIKPFIAMAPFVYLSEITSIIRFSGVLEPLMSSRAIPLLRLGAFLPIIGRYFCGNSIFRAFCVLFDFAIGGYDYPELDITMIARQFAHFPDSTSSFSVAHTGQRINNRNFAYYDYGVEKNMRIYGQIKPPNYNLSSIDSKFIVVMSGLNDILADPTDIDLLRSQLTVPLYEDYVIPYELWSHRDFIFGKNNGKYINAPILRILDSLN